MEAGPGIPATSSRTAPGLKRSRIAELLWHGEAYGFLGEVRTCIGVIKVIEEECGVRNHKGDISPLLREPQRAPQVPIHRATQRS